MASVKFSKDSAEFSWFGDFWKTVQKYWNPENGDYWKEAYEDLSSLYDKYAENPKLARFGKKMTLAYLEFLEGESRIEG